MTVYAKCPDRVTVNYLTAGKLYQVSNEGRRGFKIVDDGDRNITCLWVGCAHANGDWERFEVDDGLPLCIETPTLRDQFAMAALGGLISIETYQGMDAVGVEVRVANRAYMLAEAMIEARKKGN